MEKVIKTEAPWFRNDILMDIDYSTHFRMLHVLTYQSDLKYKMSDIYHIALPLQDAIITAHRYMGQHLKSLEYRNITPYQLIATGVYGLNSTLSIIHFTENIPSTCGTTITRQPSNIGYPKHSDVKMLLHKQQTKKAAKVSISYMELTTTTICD